MSLIVYLSGENESSAGLLRIIEDAIPGYQVEMYASISDLTLRLQQPHVDISVAVLYAATRADLMEIIFLEKILSELRLVLVLPDRDPKTLEKVHILRPRFVAGQNDFEHLGSVLKKMMELYDKPHRVKNKIFR